MLLAYRIQKFKTETIHAQQTLLQFQSMQAEELTRQVNERTDQFRVVNERLTGALKERDLLIREIHHRVKNNLQSIVGLLHLQARRSTHAESKAVLGESSAKIKAIAAIHELLYGSDDLGKIDIKAYLPRLVESFFSSIDGLSVDVRYRIDPVLLTMDQAVAVGTIAVEVLTNAYKHAVPEDGKLQVFVAVEVREHHVRLTVHDNGKAPAGGFENIREGMGMAIVAQTCERLKGGTYRFVWQQGALFELEFDYA